MDSSPPGSSVHEILKARTLEWVASPFSRESSWPRDQTLVCHIAGKFFTVWGTREAPVPQVKTEVSEWVKSLSRVPLFVTPWTVAYKAPLSMKFSRQEYCSGVAISFSRESSRPRDWTRVSCIAGRRFTFWATREVVKKKKKSSSTNDKGQIQEIFCRWNLHKL